jgi:hypothetical protein
MHNGEKKFAKSGNKRTNIDCGLLVINIKIGREGKRQSGKAGGGKVKLSGECAGWRRFVGRGAHLQSDGSVTRAVRLTTAPFRSHSWIANRYNNITGILFM